LGEAESGSSQNSGEKKDLKSATKHNVPLPEVLQAEAVREAGIRPPVRWMRRRMQRERESERVQDAAVFKVQSVRPDATPPVLEGWCFVRFYAFFYKEKIKCSGKLIGTGVKRIATRLFFLHRILAACPGLPRTCGSERSGDELG